MVKYWEWSHCPSLESERPTYTKTKRCQGIMLDSKSMLPQSFSLLFTYKLSMCSCWLKVYMTNYTKRQGFGILCVWIHMGLQRWLSVEEHSLPFQGSSHERLFIVVYSSGDLSPSPGLHGHQVHLWWTSIYIGKPLTHIQKKKKKTLIHTEIDTV